MPASYMMTCQAQVMSVGAGGERRYSLGCFKPLPLPPDLIHLASVASKAGASEKQVSHDRTLSPSTELLNQSGWPSSPESVWMAILHLRSAGQLLTQGWQ